MVTVPTVLDLPATDLGPTDYHEHLFQASPVYIGDELGSEAASGQEAANPARLVARFPSPDAATKETHG